MPSLSVCVFANTSPQRLAALLAPLRAIADEIVVAIDDSTPYRDLTPLDDVADAALVAPFTWTLNRNLEWLYAQCAGEWVLRLDGDEFASHELLDVLAGDGWHRNVTHCSIPRRWLVGDGYSWIQSNPWWPDHQVRLLKNDSSLMDSGSGPHKHAVVKGPGRALAAPVYHMDLVDMDLASRREKARRYFRADPKLRAHSGHAMNVYYTPELVIPQPSTLPVPSEDEPLVAAVLANARFQRMHAGSDGRGRVQSPVVSGQSVLVELIDPDTSGYSGTRVELLATVTNNGTEPLDPTGHHPIRIGGRWVDTDDSGTAEARADLPCVLQPGDSESVMLPVEIPQQEGDHLLRLGAVAEGSHWFDTALNFEFTSLGQPGIIFENEALSYVEAGMSTSIREEIADRFPQMRVVPADDI